MAIKSNFIMVVVFIDIVCGDQLLSDSYPQSQLVYNGEDLAGLTFVQSENVEKGAVSVNTGANASAEEAAEDGDDNVEKVNNIVDAEIGFAYEGPMTLKKSEFGVMYKNYCKKMKDAIIARGDKPKPFMESAKAFLEFMNKEFSNFEIYQSKSYDNPAFIVGWWDDEANTIGAPKFIYFEHGMFSEKY